MNTLEPSTLSVRFLRAINQRICPECGSVMEEVNRSEEGGATFIWYECSREDCYGQWLQKNAEAV